MGIKKKWLRTLSSIYELLLQESMEKKYGLETYNPLHDSRHKEMKNEIIII